MITKMFFWALLIIFILGLISNSITIDNVEDNLIITIEYKSIFSNISLMIERTFDFIFDFFGSSDQPIIENQ